MEGRVGLGGKLHAETVAHPSTNRARRRATWPIGTSALPLYAKSLLSHELTLNCSDEGHSLMVAGVVVEENVPNADVEELNERRAHH